MYCIPFSQLNLVIILSYEFREHAIFNTLCYLCILAVPGGQPKIVNNSDELTNEVQELRAELAQLKETVSGEKLLYKHIQK